MISEKSNPTAYNPWRAAWQRFRSDKLAWGALTSLGVLLFAALAAPLIANPRPLLQYTPQDGMTMPFLRSYFAPESTEFCIEQLFIYA